MAEPNLEKMTAMELREYALKHHPEITGVHALKKEDLLRAIHEARGEPAKKERPAAVPLDKGGLKRQIRELKAERDKFIPAHDSQAILRLRKKIKRLKRLIKKGAAPAPGTKSAAPA